MSIPKCQNLSIEQIKSLPCVVCGNPFGDTPGAGSYGICTHCWWEDCEWSFYTPWKGGGPNYFSLWQSRRNYELSGISVGPFWRPDLTPQHQPVDDRYDWDLDPEFYADCASQSWYDPIVNTLVVLRYFGLFSARQIRQKLVKRAEVFMPGASYSFPHTAVKINKRSKLDTDKRWESNVGVQSVVVSLESENPQYQNTCKYEFINRIQNLSVESLSESEIEFAEVASNPSSFLGKVVNAKQREDTPVWMLSDVNDYWIRADFMEDRIRQLTFMADEDGSEPFIELDHDKEIIRNASNA